MLPAVEVRRHADGPLAGQRGLFARTAIAPGQLVLKERPLLAAQHLWNRAFGYLCCAHCLRPLESAAQAARRLLGLASLPELPDAAQCDQPLVGRCQCPACGEHYCSPACADAAADGYHRSLCPGTTDPDERAGHLVGRIEAAWMAMMPPPETASITSVLKLLGLIQHRLDRTGQLDQAVSILDGFRGTGAAAGPGQLPLLAACDAGLRRIHSMVAQLFPDQRLGEWRSWERFGWLLAVVCTNAVGVGISPFERYETARLKIPGANPDAVRAPPGGAVGSLAGQNRKIFGRVAQRVGPFDGVEGCALYAEQSSINHSCSAHVTNKYEAGDAQLHVFATRAARPGEELTLCYIEAAASYSERQSDLSQFYLFDCSCSLCKEQQAAPPEEIATDPEIDRALALLGLLEQGDLAGSSAKLDLVLSKSSVQRLEEAAAEAAAAMNNFELIHTDRIRGYQWEQVKSVRSIARQLLMASARRTGCVEITKAVLSKKRAKSFGSKQARRDGVGCAFVEACSLGVMDQVVYMLSDWAEALDSLYKPIGLVCATELRVTARQQGMAQAALAGQLQVSQLLSEQTGELELTYLLKDTAAPVDYFDALCRNNECRMVEHRLATIDGQLLDRCKRAKLA